MTDIETPVVLDIPDDWSPREPALMAFAFQASVEAVRAVLDNLSTFGVPSTREQRVAILADWARWVATMLPEGVTVTEQR